MAASNFRVIQISKPHPLYNVNTDLLVVCVYYCSNAYDRLCVVIVQIVNLCPPNECSIVVVNSRKNKVFKTSASTNDVSTMANDVSLVAVTKFILLWDGPGALIIV